MKTTIYLCLVLFFLSGFSTLEAATIGKDTIHELILHNKYKVKGATHIKEGNFVKLILKDETKVRGKVDDITKEGFLIDDIFYNYSDIETLKFKNKEFRKNSLIVTGVTTIITLASEGIIILGYIYLEENFFTILGLIFLFTTAFIFQYLAFISFGIFIASLIFKKKIKLDDYKMSFK